MFAFRSTSRFSTGGSVRSHLYTPGHPNLILVGLPWQRDKDPAIPFSHLSLFTNIDQKKTNLVDIVQRANAIHNRDRFLPVDLLASRLASAIIVEVDDLPSAPTWVGFGAYTWNEAVIWATMRRIHEARPWVQFVLGGPSITHGYEDLAEQIPVLSTLIRGYAEFALPKVVLGDADSLKGVYHTSGEVERMTTDFSWSGWQSPFLVNPKLCIGPTGFARWITKLGCPHSCYFCQYSATGRSRIIEKPWEMIEAELEAMLARGVSEINIQDAIFHVGRHWRRILEYLIEHEYRGKLTLQCHFDHLPRAFLKLCRQLKVQLEYGLQTANPAEARFINRRVDRVKVAVIVREMLRRGIYFSVSVIYGLPGQTLESFEETVAFLRDLGVPKIEAFPLSLYAGTELTNQRDHWGFVTSDADPFHHVLASNTATKEDIKLMSQIAAGRRSIETGV